MLRRDMLQMSLQKLQKLQYPSLLSSHFAQIMEQDLFLSTLVFQKSRD